MTMKLFVFLLLSVIYLASATNQHPPNYLFKPRHKHRRLSHLHPKFRRLSVNGMLDLKLNGQGFFMFRDRVTDKTQDLNYLNHESMAGSPNHYDSAYIARI
jgi:hypothetical protein